MNPSNDQRIACVFTLNNIGVSFLTRFHCKDAAVVFSEAAGVMKEYIQSQASPCCKPDVTSNWEAIVRTRSQQLATCSTQLCSPSRFYAVNAHDDSADMLQDVINAPDRLINGDVTYLLRMENTSHCNRSAKTVPDRDIESAIILYNFGCACLSGASTPKTQMHQRQVAVSLFDLSYQLLQSKAFDEDVNFDALLPTFLVLRELIHGNTLLGEEQQVNDFYVDYCCLHRSISATVCSYGESYSAAKAA